MKKVYELSPEIREAQFLPTKRDPVAEREAEIKRAEEYYTKFKGTWKLRSKNLTPLQNRSPENERNGDLYQKPKLDRDHFDKLMIKCEDF